MIRFPLSVRRKSVAFEWTEEKMFGFGIKFSQPTEGIPRAKSFQSTWCVPETPLHSGILMKRKKISQAYKHSRTEVYCFLLKKNCRFYKKNFFPIYKHTSLKYKLIIRSLCKQYILKTFLGFAVNVDQSWIQIISQDIEWNKFFVTRPLVTVKWKNCNVTQLTLSNIIIACKKRWKKIENILNRCKDLDKVTKSIMALKICYHLEIFDFVWNPHPS